MVIELRLRQYERSHALYCTAQFVVLECRCRIVQLKQVRFRVQLNLACFVNNAVQACAATSCIPRFMQDKVRLIRSSLHVEVLNRQI